MKKLKIILLLCVFSFGISSAQSSDDQQDLESWTSIALKYKINKKWEVELQEQFRLKENISVTDQYFTQLDGSYKVTKNLSLGAGLRYINSNDNKGNIQGYEQHFRYHFDVSFKHKINDFTLKHRLRYQNKNELGVSEAEGDYAKKNLRFKSSVNYNFNNWKLDPKFSAEIFNRSEEGEENGFNKYRLTLGTSYKLKSAGEIGLYYRMEKELNESLPKTTNIIGLNYTYTFKNKK
ncbi:DUF2490 domain-containing protein [Flavicella sediminum]|uniref:DUF2490 domain-containing protein n=1 Tax=Flavicella sediminum TaxID=2585141 RepID=UPI00140B1FBA|nr:DUF2490 domain-containing protein [Flavicella sediminum]